jgi:hypothetical protein
MGFAKHLLEQQEAQGFNFVGDKYVCSNCFGDYAIREFIGENAERRKCSYCGLSSSKPIAAHMDKVMALIVEGIRFEWRDPDDVGVPFESAEGGYQGKVIDSYDLIMDEIVDELGIENDGLSRDIIDSLGGRQWCQKDFWTLGPGKALIFSWEQFVEQVKHNTRYVFLRMDGDSDSKWESETIPTSEMLDEIGRIVSELGLTEVLEPGARLWRCRVHDKSESFDTAEELGTVSSERAKYSNRMSPAGIPMFYGALDELTAVQETAELREQESTIATLSPWTTLRQMRVLNLERLPKFPSLFDEAKRELRPSIEFLYSFRGDISRPIIKDGLEHVEYVPTQIVTEYFRHIYKDTEGNKVVGILYPSARNPGGIACVLFIENESCCDTTDESETSSEESRPKYLLLNRNQIKRVAFSVRCELATPKTLSDDP